MHIFPPNRIHIKGAFSTEEIKVLAQALLEHIPLVLPSKQNEIEQLLYYLQTRKGPSAEDGIYFICMLIY